MQIKLFGRVFGRNTDEQPINKFNQAFLRHIGTDYTKYDSNGLTYINKGYNINPTVYAVINQQAKKSASVPFYIKKVKDGQSARKLKQFKSVTNYSATSQQKIKEALLHSKAYEKGDLPFPMEKPNENQEWHEIIALYKTMMKTSGNFFLYMFKRSTGEPMQVFVLPSQFTQIVLKQNTNFLGAENPIDHYMMIQGDTYVEFGVDEVIHVKYSNPNYGQDGQQLYGFSPLRVALKNIQSTNVGLDLNIKTLKSGGAFGFIHGKGNVLTNEQAQSLKSRLVEMNNDPSDLGKIAGSSAEIGFTRLSLSSAELMPFDYFRFDEKQICNILGWSDKMLNNDEGSNFGAYMEVIRKKAITDDIMPDLDLLAEALTAKFLPLFKGYKGAELCFDASDLPEMQEDITEMVKWLNDALDRGVITRNEYRKAINYMENTDSEMNEHTVQNPVTSLKDSLENPFNMQDA